MPGSKLNKGDIFDDSFFKALKDADKELKSLLTTFNKLAKEARDISKGVQAAKTFDDMSKKAAKAGKSIKDLTAEEKKLEAAQKRVTFAQSDAGKKLAVLNERTRRAAQENRKFAKSQVEQAKSTNTFSKALGSFQFKFNALGNIAANVFSRLTQGVKQFLKGSLEAFDKQIKAEKSLFVAMEGRVGATNRLIQQAKQLQKLTLFGDEDTIRAQALIAAFVDEEAAIKRVIPLVQDMAQAKGMDLAGAADLVSKTLGSSTNALSRYGIEVTGAVGSTERLESLTRGLTDAFGGQAQAAALVDAQFTSLKNTIGDIQESIGGFIADTIFLFKVQTGLLGKNLEQVIAISEEEIAAGNRFKEFVKELGDDASSEAVISKLQEVKAEQKEIEDRYNNIVKGFSDLSKAEKDVAIETTKSLRSQKLFYDELIPLIESQIDNIEDAEDARRKELEAYNNSKIEEKRRAEAVETAKYLKLLQEIRDESGNLVEEEQEAVSLIGDEFAKAWETIGKSTEGVFQDLEDSVNQTFDNTTEKIQEETEARRRQQEEERQAALDLRDIKIETANQSFDVFKALSDRRIDKVNKELAEGVISEEKAEKEKRKIRRQTAVLDKVQSLFNIAINTAVGVSNAASKVATIPLIPFIIGLGIAQAATVIATPIPQFEKGVDSAPGGLAVTGEKGQELMFGPDGKISLTPDHATLMDVDRGTKIIPADVTKEIMKYAAVATGMGSRANDSKLIVEMMGRIDDSTERLRRELKNKPVASSILTPAGILTSTHKGNTTIKKLNKFFG